MESITPRSRVSVSSEQVSSALGEEVIILNLRKGIFFGLDEIGAFIWNRIQKPILVSEVLAELLREYDVSEKTCSEDVCALLRDMKKKGLVEIQHEKVG